MNDPEQIGPRFRAAKVLVAGDLMLDEYILGVVSRISPEAPVPVLDARSRIYSPGGAANVAMNIAGLGATARLCGLIGNDSAGVSLRELLLAAGISTDLLVDSGARGTISKTRIVAGQQQICRIDHEVRGDIRSPLLERFLEASESAIASCAAAVLSDYGKGALTEAFCAGFIGRARALGKAVIVDPKSRDLRKYAGCSVVTPNLQEAAAASGIAIDSEEALNRAGRRISETLPGSAILITRGPQGMTLFQPDTAPFSVPALARKVFDVVGAGDTAVAVLAVAISAGLPLHDAVEWANRAAGIVVEKPGTAAIAWEELAAHAP